MNHSAACLATLLKRARERASRSSHRLRIRVKRALRTYGRRTRLISRRVHVMSRRRLRQLRQSLGRGRGGGTEHPGRMRGAVSKAAGHVTSRSRALASAGRSGLRLLRRRYRQASILRRTSFGAAGAVVIISIALLVSAGESAPDADSQSAARDLAALPFPAILRDAQEELVRAEEELGLALRGARRKLEREADLLAAVPTERAVRLHHAVADAHTHWARLRTQYEAVFGTEARETRQTQLARLRGLAPQSLREGAVKELAAAFRAEAQHLHASTQTSSAPARETIESGLYRVSPFLEQDGAQAGEIASLLPGPLRDAWQKLPIALDVRQSGTYVLGLDNADGLTPLHAGSWSVETDADAISLSASVIEASPLDTPLSWASIRVRLDESDRSAHVRRLAGDDKELGEALLPLLGPALAHLRDVLQERLDEVRSLRAASRDAIQSARRVAANALASLSTDAGAQGRAAHAQYVRAIAEGRRLTWEQQIRQRRVFARAPVQAWGETLRRSLPSRLRERAYNPVASELVKLAQRVDALQRALERSSEAATPFASEHRHLAGEYTLRTDAPIRGVELPPTLGVYLLDAGVRLRLFEDGAFVLFSGVGGALPHESGLWTPTEHAERIQLTTLARGSASLSREEVWSQSYLRVVPASRRFSIDVNGPGAPNAWIEGLRSAARKAPLDALRPVIRTPEADAFLATTHVEVAGHVPRVLPGAILRVNGEDVALDKDGHFRTVVHGKTETAQKIDVVYGGVEGMQSYASTLSVNLDPARPRIRIKTPHARAGFIGAGVLHVEGRIEEMRIAKAQLIVNGERQDLPIPSSGALTFAEDIRLASGQSASVEVRVTDAAGNRAEWSEHYEYNPLRYHQKQAVHYAQKKDWERTGSHYDQVMRHGGRVHKYISDGVVAWRKPPIVKLRSEYHEPGSAPVLHGTIKGLRNDEKLVVGGKTVAVAGNGAFSVRFAKPLAEGTHGVSVHVEPENGQGTQRLAEQKTFRVGRAPTVTTMPRSGRGSGRGGVRMNDAGKVAAGIALGYAAGRILR